MTTDKDLPPLPEPMSDYPAKGQRIWDEAAVRKAQRDAFAEALAARPGMLDGTAIREIFLAHGFTIKPGCDDLKPYVYDAARALIAAALAGREGADCGEYGHDQGACGNASCMRPKPVAWRDPHDHSSLYWRKPPTGDAEPLYTHPAAQPAQRVAPAEVLAEAMELAGRHAHAFATQCGLYPASYPEADDAVNSTEVALRDFLSKHLGAQRVEQAEPVPADRAELASELRDLACACIWDACEQARDPENPVRAKDRSDSVTALFDAIDRLAGAPAPADDQEQAIQELVDEAQELGMGYGADPTGMSPVAPAPAQGEQTRSQKLAAAGITPRDTRIECDDCGAKCTPQMLPVHKCQAAQGEREAAQEMRLSLIVQIHNLIDIAERQSRRMHKMGDTDERDYIDGAIAHARKVSAPYNYNGPYRAALAAQPAAAPEPVAADTARMDWLERHVVNVRFPLRYGSREMFWASPDDVDGGEDDPSDIRAKIDAALAKEGGA